MFNKVMDLIKTKDLNVPGLLFYNYSKLNLDYEHYKISEWNVLANKSYNAIHIKNKIDYIRGVQWCFPCFYAF